MSRPIPDTHESRLKNVLGVPEQEDLPKEVQDLFWQVEKVSRVIRNSGVSDDALILIAVLAGAHAEKKPAEFLEIAQILDKGELIEAQWRGEWRLGEFVGLKGKRIVIRFSDDTEPQREFDPHSVRLPDGVTLEL